MRPQDLIADFIGRLDAVPNKIRKVLSPDDLALALIAELERENYYITSAEAHDLDDYGPE